MKSFFSNASRLVVICGISALVLGVVNTLTESVALTRKEKALQSALNELVPEEWIVREEHAIEPEGAVSAFYPVESQNGATQGAVLVLLGQGYGGEMQILGFFTNDGRIEAALLLDNQETPGLGKKAEDSAYMKQFFVGTGEKYPVPTRKADMAEGADAIAGATITFTGIARALAEGSTYMRRICTQ